MVLIAGLRRLERPGQGRSQKFVSEGVMGYRKGGDLPKQALILAHVLPVKISEGVLTPNRPL